MTMRLLIIGFVLILNACVTTYPEGTEFVERSTEVVKESGKDAVEKVSDPDNFPAAFASSPDGGWGYWTKASTLETAKTLALMHCNKYVPKNGLKCELHTVNGEKVIPEKFKYKLYEGHHLKADMNEMKEFFPKLDFSYKFKDVEKFSVDYKTFPSEEEMNEYRKRADTKLMSNLVGKSLIFDGRLVYSFISEELMIMADAFSNGSVLISTVDDWFVTYDGLLCRVNGAYITTGKQVTIWCPKMISLNNGNIEAWYDDKFWRNGYVAEGAAALP